METVNTAGTENTIEKRGGILYPIMLIAAIAVIVFSAAGIATMMGWMPGALSGGESGSRTAVAPAATVVGAGAGAYAGNEIEKNVNRSVSYQVRVRMNDGTYRTRYEPAQPALTIGQKVRVTEQGIIAAG